MRRGQRSNRVFAIIAATGLVVVGSLGLAWRVGQEPPRKSHVSVTLTFTKTCIDQWARQHGRLPESVDEVVAQHRDWVEQLQTRPDPRAPWLLDYPHDPWGTPLRYAVSDQSKVNVVSNREDRLRYDILPEYRLWSIGPDRMDGTHDDIVAR